MHAGVYGASSQVTKMSICRVAQNNSITAKAVAYTEGGVWVFKPLSPPEIPKALQNCAKLNPICENC